MPEPKKTKPQKQPDTLEDKYPNVAEWVFGGGWIEIGETDETNSFIRALNEGGMVFEGKREYLTLDEAFQALDDGIAQWTNNHT